MFDLSGESYWMGPKPKKGKKRKETPLFGDMGASNYEGFYEPEPRTYTRKKTTKNKNSPKRNFYKKKSPVRTYSSFVKGTKAAYKGAKATYEYARKGYTGTAKQQYQKQEKKFKQRQEEAKYKQKLREEYGTKPVGEKIKGLFKRKKKSIYK